MSSARVGTTDEVAANVKSLVDRVLEADMAETVARRGREIATVLNDATQTATERAEQAWRESAPQRRDAGKRMQRVSRDAAKWSRQTWRQQLRPQLRDIWKRRTLTMGAAGAAVPVGRTLVDNAAARLNLRRREERHWRAFFLGLILGAVGGAVVAILTTPKPGRAMRDELAEKARGAAENAGDWVPLFQRAQPIGNGEPSANGEPSPTPPDMRDRAADATGESEELS